MCLRMKMMTLCRKWYHDGVQLRKAERLDSWYRRRLKQRSGQEFAARWKSIGSVNLELIGKFADIMELPNHFIFPYDRMTILFCTPYGDFREVEAIMLLEEYGILIADENTIPCQYRYAKDMFRIVASGAKPDGAWSRCRSGEA